jgi:hypothetical protein
MFLLIIDSMCKNFYTDNAVCCIPSLLYSLDLPYNNFLFSIHCSSSVAMKRKYRFLWGFGMEETERGILKAVTYPSSRRIRQVEGRNSMAEEQSSQGT